MLEAEGENLEFKAARIRYGLDELTEYCVAIANEGGGKIRKLLEELKGESRAHMRGKTAAARWYPGEDGSAD